MTHAVWRTVQRTLLPLVAAAIVMVPPPTAHAQEEPTAITPPRVSMVDGEVSFWRPGADDWAPARVNTALAAGDMLYSAERANLEIQVGPETFMRAAETTELGLQNQQTDLLQLKLTGGQAALDARRLGAQQIEIDTPGAALLIAQPGYYRIDVTGDTTRVAVRRGGRATVRTADAPASEVGSGEQLVVEGTDAPRVATYQAPDTDAWDQWNLDRSDHLLAAPSRSYLPDDIYGTDTLDQYGSWHSTPSYGQVWRPADVAPEWAPYSTGRWMWDPNYGWTWVDDAPWGWAPYHYGRWVYADNCWGWAPGPVIEAPVYAPALVAFFGGHGFGVGIGFGVPAVSWVALGWGEPVLPWWGPAGFVGHPWWGGWHGPHVINNVLVNRTTIVNLNHITYNNMHRPHAVVGVDRDHFNRGSVETARLQRVDLHSLQPFQGRLPVRPSAASLVPASGSGRRPPSSVTERAVVAAHTPHDPSPQLRAAGLHVTPHANLSRVLSPRPGIPAGSQAARFGGGQPPPRFARTEGASTLPQAPHARSSVPGIAHAPQSTGNAWPPQRLPQRLGRTDAPSAAVPPPPPHSGMRGGNSASQFSRNMPLQQQRLPQRLSSANAPSAAVPPPPPRSGMRGSSVAQLPRHAPLPQQRLPQQFSQQSAAHPLPNTAPAMGGRAVPPPPPRSRFTSPQYPIGFGPAPSVPHGSELAARRSLPPASGGGFSMPSAPMRRDVPAARFNPLPARQPPAAAPAPRVIARPQVSNPAPAQFRPPRPAPQRAPAPAPRYEGSRGGAPPRSANAAPAAAPRGNNRFFHR